jgi:ABC-type branched-subunit amino acid transport system ATPase component
LLEATAVDVRFGGVRAVNDVALSIGRAEILGLVGPNGSGKSSLLNALTGVVPATGGLTVDGQAVRLGRPAESRRAGVLRTYQTPQIYTDLSCVENLLLAVQPRRCMGFTSSILARPAMLRAERARWTKAADALERVGLGDLIEAPAAGLAYGERRLLELARAIAGEPKVLMLDEPSAGLNESETALVSTILAGLRDDGVTLLVVDHKIDFVTGLCNHIAVLAGGEIIAQGEPSDVWSNALVVDAYLGVEGA